MDVTSVMADCCLYDWYEDGKNLVHRYAAMHPAETGTDESYLLGVYLQAKYRILAVQSAVPGGGIYCQDLLNRREELFVMDLALSQSLQGDDVIATRTIPLGEYWMTGGAALPINSTKAVADAIRRIEDGKEEMPEVPGGLSLWFVRTCLAAGAADHISYKTGGASSSKPRHLPRWHPKRKSEKGRR